MRVGSARRRVAKNMKPARRVKVVNQPTNSRRVVKLRVRWEEK
jgi:hypothetical protein